MPLIEKAIRCPIELINRELDLYHSRGQLVELSGLSSKEIRELRTKNEALCLFKNGLIVTPNVGADWFNKIKKLTSVRHQSMFLRALHGEIYTKSRLFRFGLIDNPTCTRCDEIETLDHKIIECDYATRIWLEIF